jgi:hypothetical protein
MKKVGMDHCPCISGLDIDTGRQHEGWSDWTTIATPKERRKVWEAYKKIEEEYIACEDKGSAVWNETKRERNKLFKQILDAWRQAKNQGIDSAAVQMEPAVAETWEEAALALDDEALEGEQQHEVEVEDVEVEAAALESNAAEQVSDGEQHGSGQCLDYQCQQGQCTLPRSGWVDGEVHDVVADKKGAATLESESCDPVPPSKHSRQDGGATRGTARKAQKTQPAPFELATPATLLRDFNAMKFGRAAEKEQEVGRKLRERSEQIEALLEEGKDVPEELLSMVAPPISKVVCSAQHCSEPVALDSNYALNVGEVLHRFCSFKCQNIVHLWATCPGIKDPEDPRGVSGAATPAGPARTVAELEQSQEQRREELRLQDYPEPAWSSRPTTRLPSGKGKGGSKGNYGGKGGQAKGKGGRGWVTWKGQLEEYGGGAEGAAVART